MSSSSHSASIPLWEIALSSPTPGISGDETLETNELTVEAWVISNRIEPETIQSIVSQWNPLDTFDTFSAFDAGNTDGLKSTGYFGAVFDGRYIYFAPQHYEEHESHGIVLRYDKHLPFNDPAS
ncbi:MAG TPA: hypothetical protein DIU35_01945, partial [Candidatus Latescibacteria bacterium]|nr:hypothetical protein [Candidatus Latescibacterota bacterium]